MSKQGAAIPKSYARRRVTRETTAIGRYRGPRAVIVELDCVEAVLGFRLKGTRTTHHATVEQCFSLAQKLTAQRIREERSAARKKGTK